MAEKFGPNWKSRTGQKNFIEMNKLVIKEISDKYIKK